MRTGLYAHGKHLLRVSVFAVTTTTPPIMCLPGSTPPHAEDSLDSKECNPKSQMTAESLIQGRHNGKFSSRLVGYMGSTRSFYVLMSSSHMSRAVSAAQRNVAPQWVPVSSAVSTSTTAS